MNYGDYSSKSDSFLIKRRESIFDTLKNELGASEMDLVQELCEVERELTLRETE